MEKRQPYPTDLTEDQWNRIAPLIPAVKPGGRPAKYPRREIVSAIFYQMRGGAAWRMLPHDLPPWRITYHYFRVWRKNGTWEQIHDQLRGDVREAVGREREPSAGCVDSQSVKTTERGGVHGYDAGKKVNGRKRHVLVDTLGLLLGVAVTSASSTERAGAQVVLGRVLTWFTWLRLLWVDGGYTGATFANWVKELRPKLAVEVVKRSDPTAGFKVLPRRWVVERTFGWLMHHRRLARDYETSETSAEAWIFIAMIRIQLRRLA